MTLTHMGRVLYKNERTGKWSAQRGRGSKVPGPVKIDQAAAQAAMFRMERVK